MTSVSVVIPAYNCVRFIERTVRSALAQRTAGVDVEIIVVDDGSSDGTGEVVQAMGEGVRYLRKANGGVSSARNLGVQHAQGDFICFLDADDVLAEGWFAHALAAAARKPEAGAVFGKFHRWAAGEDVDPAPVWQSLQASQNVAGDELNAEFTGWIYHQMLLDSWVLCSAALVKREVVMRSGGFEEGVPMGEDWDFWIRVSRICPVVAMRRVAVLYRQHPQSASRKLRDMNYAADLIERAIRQHGFAGPTGVSASRSEVHAVLAQHNLWHAIAHLGNGRYAIGLRAIWAATRYQPARAAHWRLLIVSLLGLGRPYVRYVIER